MRFCPICGDYVVKRKVRNILKYKGYYLDVKENCRTCMNCGESFADTGKNLSFERTVSEFHNSVDKLLRKENE